MPLVDTSRTLARCPVGLAPTQWSDENLIAAASGSTVMILDPAQLSGPLGFVALEPDDTMLGVGNLNVADGDMPSVAPMQMRQQTTPSARSLCWSPLGVSAAGGCMLAVATSDGVVKVFESATLEMRSQWREVADLSVQLVAFHDTNGWKAAAALSAAYEEMDQKERQRLRTAFGSANAKRSVPVLPGRDLSVSLAQLLRPAREIPNKRSRGVKRKAELCLLPPRLDKGAGPSSVPMASPSHPVLQLPPKVVPASTEKAPKAPRGHKGGATGKGKVAVATCFASDPEWKLPQPKRFKSLGPVFVGSAIEVCRKSPDGIELWCPAIVTAVDKTNLSVSYSPDAAPPGLGGLSEEITIRPAQTSKEEADKAAEEPGTGNGDATAGPKPKGRVDAGVDRKGKKVASEGGPSSKPLLQYRFRPVFVRKGDDRSADALCAGQRAEVRDGQRWWKAVVKDRTPLGGSATAYTVTRWGDGADFSVLSTHIREHVWWENHGWWHLPAGTDAPAQVEAAVAQDSERAGEAKRPRGRPCKDSLAIAIANAVPGASPGGSKAAHQAIIGKQTASAGLGATPGTTGETTLMTASPGKERSVGGEGAKGAKAASVAGPAYVQGAVLSKMARAAALLDELPREISFRFYAEYEKIPVDKRIVYRPGQHMRNNSDAELFDRVLEEVLKERAGDVEEFNLSTKEVIKRTKVRIRTMILPVEAKTSSSAQAAAHAGAESPGRKERATGSRAAGDGAVPDDSQDGKVEAAGGAEEDELGTSGRRSRRARRGAGAVSTTHPAGYDMKGVDDAKGGEQTGGTDGKEVGQGSLPTLSPPKKKWGRPKKVRPEAAPQALERESETRDPRAESQQTEGDTGRQREGGMDNGAVKRGNEEDEDVGGAADQVMTEGEGGKEGGPSEGGREQGALEEGPREQREGDEPKAEKGKLAGEDDIGRHTQGAGDKFKEGKGGRSSENMAGKGVAGAAVPGAPAVPAASERRELQVSGVGADALLLQARGSGDSEMQEAQESSEVAAAVGLLDASIVPFAADLPVLVGEDDDDDDEEDSDAKSQGSSGSGEFGECARLLRQMREKEKERAMGKTTTTLTKAMPTTETVTKASRTEATPATAPPAREAWAKAALTEETAAQGKATSSPREVSSSVAGHRGASARSTGGDPCGVGVGGGDGGLDHGGWSSGGHLLQHAQTPPAKRPRLDRAVIRAGHGEQGLVGTGTAPSYRDNGASSAAHPVAHPLTGASHGSQPAASTVEASPAARTLVRPAAVGAAGTAPAPPISQDLGLGACEQTAPVMPATTPAVPRGIAAAAAAAAAGGGGGGGAAASGSGAAAAACPGAANDTNGSGAMATKPPPVTTPAMSGSSAGPSEPPAPGGLVLRKHKGTLSGKRDTLGDALKGKKPGWRSAQAWWLSSLEGPEGGKNDSLPAHEFASRYYSTSGSAVAWSPLLCPCHCCCGSGEVQPRSGVARAGSDVQQGSTVVALGAGDKAVGDSFLLDEDGAGRVTRKVGEGSGGGDGAVDGEVETVADTGKKRKGGKGGNKEKAGVVGPRVTRGKKAEPIHRSAEEVGRNNAGSGAGDRTDGGSAGRIRRTEATAPALAASGKGRQAQGAGGSVADGSTSHDRGGDQQSDPVAQPHQLPPAPFSLLASATESGHVYFWSVAHPGHYSPAPPPASAPSPSYEPVAPSAQAETTTNGPSGPISSSNDNPPASNLHPGPVPAPSSRPAAAMPSAHRSRCGMPTSGSRGGSRGNVGELVVEGDDEDGSPSGGRGRAVQARAGRTSLHDQPPQDGDAATDAPEDGEAPLPSAALKPGLESSGQAKPGGASLAVRLVGHLVAHEHAMVSCVQWLVLGPSPAAAAWGLCGAAAHAPPFSAGAAAVSGAAASPVLQGDCASRVAGVQGLCSGGRAVVFHDGSTPDTALASATPRKGAQGGTRRGSMPGGRLGKEKGSEGAQCVRTGAVDCPYASSMSATTLLLMTGGGDGRVRLWGKRVDDLARQLARQGDGSHSVLDEPFLDALAQVEPAGPFHMASLSCLASDAQGLEALSTRLGQRCSHAHSANAPQVGDETAGMALPTAREERSTGKPSGGAAPDGMSTTGRGTEGETGSLPKLSLAVGLASGQVSVWQWTLVAVTNASGQVAVRLDAVGGAGSKARSFSSDAHSMMVTSLTWSPDGSRIFTSSQDGTRACLRVTSAGLRKVPKLFWPLPRLSVAYSDQGDPISMFGARQVLGMCLSPNGLFTATVRVAVSAQSRWWKWG
eukprot:jgi/Mesvir1/16882/Mv15764-RA.3